MYYISVKISENEYRAFPVPEEIYTYVRQLESYIRYPEVSNLLDLYKERFSVL